MSAAKGRGMRIRALVLVALAACGGSTTDVSGTDGGSIGDASSGDASIDHFANDAGSDGAAADSGADSSPRDGGTAINHRPDDSQCRTTPPAGNCAIPNGLSCTHDSDCTNGTNGRCVETTHGARLCNCTYDACMHDTDCPTGKLCACHGSPYTSGGGNTCIDGNCRVDSDCASGACSPSHGGSGCGGVTGYYCHTAADTCTNDSDCADGGLQVCGYSTANRRWECVNLPLCP